MKLAIIGESSESITLISWLLKESVELVWFLPPGRKSTYEADFSSLLKMIDDPICRIQNEFEFNDNQVIEKKILSDLFWVVTKPLKVKMDENSFAQISKEYHEDMLRPMECYESVDGVIELFNKNSNYLHPYLGENAYALEETWCREVHRKFFLDGNCLNDWMNAANEIKAKDTGRLFLLGSRPGLSEHLLHLWELCKAGQINVYWSHGYTGEQLSDSCYMSIEDEKRRMEDELVKTYFLKLDEWNLLENYEKAKISKPTKPTLNWEEVKGFKIKSFAKLQNHTELMIHLENRSGETRVLSVDACSNQLSLQSAYLSLYLPSQPAGSLLFLRESVEEMKQKIREKLFSYFTKVE